MWLTKKSILTKTIPLWLVLVIVLNFGLVVGAGEYWLMKKHYLQQIKELQLSADPEALIESLKAQVLPAEGYTTSLSWGDLVQRLVDVGAIDVEQYEQIFTSNVNGLEEMSLLTSFEDKPIIINENNSRFLVNTLWALGLTNKSKVLDEGPMVSGETPTENFASTGGWTLGKKPAMELYSSEEIIVLTNEQQDLVKKIAGNVYRPCCGNSTAFPDCNHGMAALGYIELAVAGGLSEKQIYKDLLAFNSFWFPQTYLEMAIFFKTEEGVDWSQVEAQKALSSDFSSALGAQKISQQVKNVPGLESQGGSCGV